MSYFASAFSVSLVFDAGATAGLTSHHTLSPTPIFPLPFFGGAICLVSAFVSPLPLCTPYRLQAKVGCRSCWCCHSFPALRHSLGEVALAWRRAMGSVTHSCHSGTRGAEDMGSLELAAQKPGLVSIRDGAWVIRGELYNSPSASPLVLPRPPWPQLPGVSFPAGLSQAGSYLHLHSSPVLCDIALGGPLSLSCPKPMSRPPCHRQVRRRPGHRRAMPRPLSAMRPTAFGPCATISPAHHRPASSLTVDGPRELGLSPVRRRKRFSLVGGHKRHSSLVCHDQEREEEDVAIHVIVTPRPGPCLPS